VGVWWAAIKIFSIPAYLLPGPGGVFTRLVTDASLLWTHSQVTLTEILLGFGLTVVTAIPLGLVIALSPLAKQLVYPPLMLMQLVPKIAVAPLFLVWLGFGIESKVLLTVLMTFFPLLLASISGFQILDDRLLYLTRSMGATSWQTFRFLRFPAALPVIFSGIKTSATIAATAAIVAEFVGAANLVPVRVVELREVGVVVEAAGGARLPVNSGGRAWALGAPALLCLRPEALVVEEAALAPGGIPGTVLSQIFEGSRQLYEVDISGATLRVETLTTALHARTLKPGDHVKVQVSPETSVLLPDEPSEPDAERR